MKKQQNHVSRRSSAAADTSAQREHTPEILQRYLFAVGSRLPDKGREDILQELESDILERLDMDAPGTTDRSERLSQLLVSFGDPEAISRQYGGRPSVLIGAELFPSYGKVLRLVLTIVLTLLSFVYLISIVFSPTDTTGIISLLTDWLSALFQGALSVFATVTLSFAIAERVMGKNGTRFHESGAAWTPDLLPQLPDAADRVKPAGLITGILFTMLGAGILILQRDLLGVIMKVPSQDKTVLIPLFNERLMNVLLWAILPLMVLSVVNAVWKLAAGRFTSPTRILSAFLCFGGAIATVLIFNHADLLDPARGLAAALEGKDVDNLMTALRLSFRITSAAIAIPLVIEGIGHVRHLLAKAIR